MAVELYPAPRYRYPGTGTEFSRLKPGNSSRRRSCRVMTHESRCAAATGMWTAEPHLHLADLLPVDICIIIIIRPHHLSLNLGTVATFSQLLEYDMAFSEYMNRILNRSESNRLSSEVRG